MKFQRNIHAAAKCRDALAPAQTTRTSAWLGHACCKTSWFIMTTAILGGLGLAGCATTPTTSAPAVTRLTTKSYAPTQTVDVLSAVPQRAFQRIAQLQLNDPTGSATRSQLIAQLTATARSLGANALVVAPTQQGTAGSTIGFNPSGGQMQGSSDQTSLTVSALAIRYTAQ